MKRLTVVCAVSSAVVFSGCAVSPFESAKEYYQQRNYSKAVESYQEALRQEPANPTYMRGIADAYLANKEYLEASQWYQKYRSLSPKDDTVLCGIMIAQYQIRDYPKALVAIDQLHQGSMTSWAYRSYPECPNLLNDLYERNGRYDKVIAGLKQQIQQDARNGTNFLKLAQLQSKNGHYDEAISAAKRAVDLKTGVAEAYRVMGEAYGKQNRFDEAIGAYHRSLELKKNSTTAIELAQIYRRMGHATKGYELLAPYRESDDTAKMALELAEILDHSGSSSKALEVMNESIKKHTISGIGIEIEKHGESAPVVMKVEKGSPADANGILQGDKIIKVDGEECAKLSLERVVQKLRGVSGSEAVVSIQRRDEGIEKRLTRSSFVLKEAAGLLAKRSSLYLSQGNVTDAMADAKMCELLNPNEARLPLARLAIAKDEYAQAMTYLESLPNTIETMMLKALAEAKLGHNEKAIERYRTLLADEAVGSVAVEKDRQTFLATMEPIKRQYLAEAQKKVASGAISEGLEMYATTMLLASDETKRSKLGEEMAKVIIHHPVNAVLSEEAHRHVVRGELLIREGKIEEGSIELKKAQLVSPWSARLYFNIAIVESKLERYGSAITYMKRYFNAAPNAPDLRAAKDEVIKWELLMEKPKSYPVYKSEENPDGVSSESVEGASNRQRFLQRRIEGAIQGR